MPHHEPSIFLLTIVRHEPVTHKIRVALEQHEEAELRDRLESLVSDEVIERWALEWITGELSSFHQALALCDQIQQEENERA